MIFKIFYNSLKLKFKRFKYRKIISQLEKIIGKVDTKLDSKSHIPTLRISQNNVHLIDIIEKSDRITVIEYYPIYGVNYPNYAEIKSVYSIVKKTLTETKANKYGSRIFKKPRGLE